MNAMEIVVEVATTDDAADMLAVSRAAFAARRPVEPPAEALSDTLDDVLEALASGYGVVARLDGEVVGSLIVALDGRVATLRRVSVLPEHKRHGVAHRLVAGATSLAVDLGCTRVELQCRREFPELVQWWANHGFTIDREAELGVILSRPLPVIVEVPTREAMQHLGRRLAGILRAGDVVIASGELGAGKTTLTQGLGEGLGVAGPVISPTFVISRVHRSLGDGPDLVHVDAYRMGDAAELVDIDLDATLESAVTLVEWGAGKAEWLSDDRLEILIERSDDPADEGRTVVLDGVGARWAGALDILREDA